MDPFNQYFEKVNALVVRHLDTAPELLLYAPRYEPDAPLQTPGGGIHDGETPEEALWCKVGEATGYTMLPILRKIGVSETPWIFRSLRRHCYLLDGSGLPESWSHTVTGEGIHQGEHFHFSWYKVGEHLTLGGDLGYFLNAEALPDLFPQAARES